jgi:hypothetical protein
MSERYEMFVMLNNEPRRKLQAVTVTKLVNVGWKEI